MAKPQVEKDTSERWTVTYADLMNLLLILFIILYSMSKLDAEKSEQVQQSLETGFSSMLGAAAITAAGEGGKGLDSNTYWVTDPYGEFYNEISLLIQNSNLQDKIDVKVDDTGVIISFKDSALFISGSANLSQEACTIISDIGKMLGKLSYSFILVEGHTDSDPIIGGGLFKDNMDLSSARAGNVWRELVKCGIPPEKMASIGYGEFRPVADNDTAENKAKNRRVVISILKMPFKASSDLVADNMQGSETQTASSPKPEASASPSSEESASPSSEESTSPSSEASPNQSSGESSNNH